jgi:hypothetical protein
MLLMTSAHRPDDPDADFSRDSFDALDEQFAAILGSPDEPDGADASGPSSEGPAESGADLESRDADDYFSLSRTPLTSLVFTLPLVLAYEGGVLLLGRGSPRNGADVWLRQLLDAMGFGSYFLLPALTVIGLLAWHHVAHDRWRFRPAVLLGMVVECLFFAAILLVIARLQQRLWPLFIADGLTGILARFIGYCGAGLYEEVLFRLILLPLAIWLLRRIGFGTLAAAAWAVLVSSLLFSAAHYVGPLGDTFSLYSFTFRTLAGVFFATLLVTRGFGIAAGTHAAYDMLVGLL